MNLTALVKVFLIATLIPGWLTYTDSANKFTMNYPREWTQKASGNIVAFLSPKADANDQFQENVNLMLQDISAQPMTLEQYTDLTKKQVTDAGGAGAIVSQGTKTIGGHKAIQLIYNFSYQGHALKVEQYFFIKGKTVFLFSYTAEPGQFVKYEQTAIAIINSFTFL
ncbi:MAG TPA: PsbP-related protein [Puia sp.]|nr:PsbP-related protein [Puia sp.]